MKIACVQTDVAFGDPRANAQAASAHLDALSQRGVDIAAFPEAYLTGYCVESADQARSIAIERGHAAVLAVAEAVDRTGVGAVIGFAETSAEGLFNSAALFEPGRSPRFYRKAHLPGLGLDKYVGAGDALPVFETCWGKIGVLICFDLRHPEAARTLALGGAELIVLPTNWPVGAEVSADTTAVARAAENRVFVATCNRAGSENGFDFIGRSKIIDPVGMVLASAGGGPQVIEAEIELAAARNKRTVIIPGKYEMEVFASRRPELYGALTRTDP